ncbi:hypothetical protein PISL3812_05470 [Talaromyces islandicus]|uniref:Uncharacterized protein n=1 Tax=Talaromyces islandicus TaxID=28573 RepID=A0A0U1M0D8_TALIS|nr:hypothetical protein PISL3812_05470 [Talaromyces islandicus]
MPSNRSKQKEKGKESEGPERATGIEEPVQTPNGSQQHLPALVSGLRKPKQPETIFTHSIDAGTWDLLMAPENWGQQAREVMRLRVVNHIQEYSHFIHLRDHIESTKARGKPTSTPINERLELAEMRYGSVNGVMANHVCLYLILRNRHKGQDSESFIKLIPNVDVSVHLLDTHGRHQQVTPTDAHGILVKRAHNKNETWFLLGVGIPSSHWETEFVPQCSQELQEGTSLCVSVKDIRDLHFDERLCSAWKSGPPSIKDASGIGYAYTTG